MANAFVLPGFASGSVPQMMQISNNYNNLTGLSTLSFNTGSTAPSTGINAGFVFTSRFTQNLTGAIVAHGASTGSPTGCRLDAFAVDVNGLPTGASLANSVYTPTPSAVNLPTFGTPFAATAGTSYAYIWSNTTAVPAANFFTIQQLSNFGVPGYFRYIKNTDGSSWQSFVEFTTNTIQAGPTYGTFGSDSPLVYVGFAGGSGTPIYNTGTSRIGRTAVKINMPHSFLVWGIGVAFDNKTGSPTGFNVAGEVCSASASLQVSDSQWAAAGMTGTTAKFWFDTPVACLANTDYYIGVTAAGTGGTQNVSNALNIKCNRPLLQPATIGPMIDTYGSTAFAAPSFSQIVNGCAGIDAFIEITGGAAAGSNFANGTIF